MTGQAVQTLALTKHYGHEAVLREVTFSADTGSIHAIAGPNGAGKSTFLKLLVGLIQPTSGGITLFGQPFRGQADVRQRVHFVSPEVELYPLFRVKDIIHYASLLYERWDAKRCTYLLDAFELSDRKAIRQLSLGMKMRLRLALALAAKPDLLLLDEATNAVDPAAKEQVLDLLLQEAANRDVCLVFATHQLQEVERIADTVSVLVNGALVTTQGVDELRPVSIERWFQSVLEKEGIRNGKLTLSESAHL